MAAKESLSTHMPLGDHLEDLRRRVGYALLGLVPILCVALAFGKPLLGFLLEPAKDALRAAGQADSFMALGPLEILGAYLKVSTIAAVVVGTPWVLYQLWLFVAPGLYPHERRYVYFLLPLSAGLTVTGVFFLYRLILPIMLAWLVGFGAEVGFRAPATAAVPEGVVFPQIPVLEADPPPETLKVGQEWVNTRLMERRVVVGVTEDGAQVLSQQLRKDAVIVQQFSVERYTSLLFTLTLAFALMFQAPVVVLLLGWVGIVDRAFLAKYRRHAVLVCLVVAAFISPGDPASLALMWIPLVGLYELGGVLLAVFPASRVSGRREDGDDGGGEG
jgi:sec-independent protein translocase protein TatC